jgi:hypothetical protein
LRTTGWPVLLPMNSMSISSCPGPSPEVSSNFL